MICIFISDAHDHWAEALNLKFLLCNQIVISRDANSIQYANMMFIAALITMSLTNNKDNTVGMHYSQSDMINFPHSR